MQLMHTYINLNMIEKYINKHIIVMISSFLPFDDSQGSQ